MSHPDRTRLLRLALRTNAAFSTVCGVILLAAAGRLEPMLGIARIELLLTGASLLPFACALAFNAQRPVPNRVAAWIAVGLDLAWVAGSAALLIGHLRPLTSAGYWAVLGVAEVVLTLAVLQIVGLRRSQPQAALDRGGADARAGS